MRYYGPYTLTAGTPLAVQIDPTATAVEIENDSTCDVLIALQDNQPSVTGGQPGSSWQNGVKPYSSKCIAVPTAPPNSSYSGTLWLLPINHAGLAATGSTGTRSLCSVISYNEGEQVLATTSMPREQTVTSQQRIISIPITAPFFPVNGSGSGNNSAALFIAGAIFTPGRWVSDGVTVHAATVYAYQALLSQRGARWVSATLVAGIWDVTAGGRAAIADQTVMAGLLWAGAPQEFIGQQPAPVVLTSLPGIETAGHTYAFSLYLTLGSGPGSSGAFTCTLAGGIRADIDTAAQVPPASIGNGAATPGGVLY